MGIPIPTRSCKSRPFASGRSMSRTRQPGPLENRRDRNSRADEKVCGTQPTGISSSSDSRTETSSSTTKTTGVAPHRVPRSIHGPSRGAPTHRASARGRARSQGEVGSGFPATSPGSDHCLDRPPAVPRGARCVAQRLKEMRRTYMSSVLLTAARRRHHPARADQAIEAGVLDVGYAEAGPPRGTPVVLLHGWPYDIHSYEEVAPPFGGEGIPGDRAVPARKRDLALSLRQDVPQRPAIGGGPRRDQADGRARDQKAILGGFDWGSRTVDIVAALWPERCIGVVGVSGTRHQRRRAAKAAAAGSRVRMVVPVLLRHRSQPGRVQRKPARFRQADLEARVADVEVRRRHLRSHRGGVRQSRSRRHRRPQLPLAAGPRKGRAAIRRARAEARRQAADHRARDHHRQRFDGPLADGKAFAKQYAGKHSHRILRGSAQRSPEAPSAFAKAIVDVGRSSR